MPGVWKRPVGRGLGVCHDPNKWQAYIPASGGRFELNLTDYPQSEDMMLAIAEVGNAANTMPVTVSKALMCDLAWAILKQYEAPHIQEELQKLQNKAGW
jgi:hypothetical protein